MSNEIIRYKPGEAMRWLQSGARTIRRNAQKRGESVIKREGHRTIGRDIAEAAEALFGVGKSALAELLHRQAQATEFVLHDEAVEIIKSTGSRLVPYSAIKSLKVNKDTVTFSLEQGSVTIKPYAHIVAGSVRVPVGWVRNGMEVPYELLIEEIAARAGIDWEKP